MMSRIGQFFGRMGLATLRISPDRNAGGGGASTAGQIDYTFPLIIRAS